MNKVGPVRQRKFQMLNRFVRSLGHVCQQYPEVDVRFRAVRLNFNGRFEMRDGFGVTPGHIRQECSGVIAGAKVIGIDAQRRFVVRNCLSRAPR